MAYAALHQLFSVLATKPEPEKMTTEESNVLLACDLNILRTVAYSSSFVGGLAWSAARRLKRHERLIVTAGTVAVTFVCAMEWGSFRNAIPCLDRILGQDATRMQKELVNILMRDNQGEAWRWKLMCKHFYPESVYDDGADKPQMRWRRRTIFTDAILPSHDISEVKPHSSYDNSPSAPDRTIPRGTHVTRTKPKVPPSSRYSDGEMVEDPFDCVFGGSEKSENVDAPDNSAESGRVLTRRQRRAQRRRRMRNQEASLDTPRHEHT